MATLTKSTVQHGEERFLLRGISWGFYLAFCKELEGRRAVRLSYNCGDMEIMIVGSPHEYFKKMLAKLVEAMLFELNMPVRSGGSMTFQREDLERGFEPDECWWIAQESAVRGFTEFDPQRHSGPDLAVEVEITRSLVDRIDIYAAMGVREVWRCDGTSLRFCILQENGSYEESKHSLQFPFLAPQHLLPYLRIDDGRDETARLRAFVDWLRQQAKTG